MPPRPSCQELFRHFISFFMAGGFLFCRYSGKSALLDFDTASLDYHVQGALSTSFFRISQRKFF
jgi:hypothetical protein